MCIKMYAICSCPDQPAQYAQADQSISNSPRQTLGHIDLKISELRKHRLDCNVRMLFCACVRLKTNFLHNDSDIGFIKIHRSLVSKSYTS